MMHSILLNLLAASAFGSPAATVAPVELHGDHAKPVIKISMDWDEYYRGQEASVTIETREDGYVIVLQTDVDGRVRVLYPLDPGNDNFVRGGRSMELPGRGGKKTFYVDGPGGTAMIYAAVSATPFHFEDFVDGDHWDYGKLYDKTMDSDFENGFTALVSRMASGHFDYDVHRYTVIAEVSYSSAPSGVYLPPATVGGGCWYYAMNPWCGGYPGPWLYGGYPGWGVGIGYGYGGWGFGFSFGWGYPYYGYGYPYYGYGYPYYGYGYPGYGYGYPYYPYYGYPYYGYPYGGGRYYTPKGGYPAGFVPIGYRPHTTGGVAGAGFSTPWRGTQGTVTTGFATTPRRPPTTRTGWTLGRPTYARPTGTSGGARAPGGKPGVNYPPSGGAQHVPPPRYVPNTGRGAPAGAGTPTRGAGPSGAAPRGAPPAAPPRSGPPASAPAPKAPPASPPSNPSGGHPPTKPPRYGEKSGEGVWSGGAVRTATSPRTPSPTGSEWNAGPRSGGYRASSLWGRGPTGYSSAPRGYASAPRGYSSGSPSAYGGRAYSGGARSSSGGGARSYSSGGARGFSGGGSHGSRGSSGGGGGHRPH